MSSSQTATELPAPASATAGPRQFLTYRLARLQARLNAQAAALLGETVGLTLGQWRMLALVVDRPGARPAELVREVGFDKALISRNIKSLVACGLLRSHADRHDQRSQRLSATAEGVALYERALPVMRARQRRLTGALSAQELAVLTRALDKLDRLLEREAEAGQ